MADDALFYVGQKAFIEKDGKVLVLFDAHKSVLDFPGGKIQEGEAKVGDPSSLAESLKREVREEVGLEIEVGDPFTVWYYEFPETHRNYGKNVYLVGFRCKYLSGEVGLSSEHESFQWVDKEDFREINNNETYFGALEEYFKIRN